MTSLTVIVTLANILLLHEGCNGQTAERQYFGSRGTAAGQPQPASVTEGQQEDQIRSDQVRSRLQQEQQNFLAFVQQQGLLRQQIQTAPAYPYVLSDATPRSNPEFQLAQLQYQQQLLEQQQKVLQLQLQQQRLQAAQADKPAALTQPQQYQQQQQKSPALLGVAFSPATSVAHTRFYGNGINYQYR